ncbi:hypothetical protein PT279_00235 [Bifidobacterium sp. ESL0784]|uniref:hypothetical protein n=1 Tax=Bifidobacterium sp. ESL0784 TaxID=2983231 RepID=UPI0023F9F990|nr:hypothetical protein [Bifidobacterium sp. ESL0784]MDF7640035.1 hypothetical protein [Bifidobacterium sp. ESL0784]
MSFPSLFPLTLNPAEGENGLLQQTQFQNGKSSAPVPVPDPGPGPNPDLDPAPSAEHNPTSSSEQKPASASKPASNPARNPVSKPASDPAPGQLPASGSDITIVIVVAFVSLTLAVPLASVAFKQLRRREE